MLDSICTRAGGLAIHARMGGNGAPLILLHGIGVSSRYLEPVAEVLARDFRVFLPELPGTGDSERPERTLGMRALARSLLAWMDAMGLDRASFLANSMGCQVALQLAIEAPKRVDRLVLVGPTVDPRWRSALRQVPRWLLEGVREPLSLWPVIVRDYLRFGPRRFAQTGEVALTDRVETKLPLVKAPTLVLRGEKDAFVSEGWIERMRRLLPRGVSASIPDAAHAAHYSRPEEVAAVVRPFLKGETTPVSLIHNPRAGKRGDESERLRAALLREGLEVRVESEDAETAMREPPRTVVVAGGDGTVARAMRAAVGRDKTLVVIPTGTANNIARALGLPLGVDAARGLGRRRCVDLGLLSGPFGMREWFVESVGVGAIADFIGTPEAKGDKRPHRARKRMQTMLSDYRGLDVDLRVDGEDLSGRYLLVEILNIPAVGPRLPLGDEVAIDDGAFRLVLATERDRDALRARLEGEPTNGPPLPTRTAKRIDLLVDGAFHVDDRVVRSRHEQLVVEVAPAAVEILQPHAH